MQDPETRFPHGMTADRPDFYPLRIFVIEDHPDTLEALQIYLEQLGHIVFSARSKAEALRGNSKGELSCPHLGY
jgi:PleD family two-component response regulator